MCVYMYCVSKVLYLMILMPPIGMCVGGTSLQNSASFLLVSRSAMINLVQERYLLFRHTSEREDVVVTILTFVLLTFDFFWWSVVFVFFWWSVILWWSFKNAPICVGNQHPRLDINRRNAPINASVERSPTNSMWTAFVAKQMKMQT